MTTPQAGGTLDNTTTQWYLLSLYCKNRRKSSTIFVHYAQFKLVGIVKVWNYYTSWPTVVWQKAKWQKDWQWAAHEKTNIWTTLSKTQNQVWSWKINTIETRTGVSEEQICITSFWQPAEQNHKNNTLDHKLSMISLLKWPESTQVHTKYCDYFPNS